MLQLDSDSLTSWAIRNITASFEAVFIFCLSVCEAIAKQACAFRERRFSTMGAGKRFDKLMARAYSNARPMSF